jgi:hypothetical protein
MSHKFNLLAQVRHRITDVLTMAVEAETEEEAFAKAKEALENYPRPHQQSDVPYCYVEHRVFDDTNVVSIENMEKEKGA